MDGKADTFPSILKKTKKREERRTLIDKRQELRDVERKAKKKIRKEGDKEKKDEKEPLPQGCTPLMYACQQGDYKALLEIIKNDPSSVQRRDRGLRCALHYCAEGGAGGASRTACADRLLMASPGLVGARDADGLTPLHLAVIQGNVPLVQLLLAAGADVRAADNEQHTVVHWATVCGEVGALRAVLAAGADVATPDQHGGYPLHYAAQMCGAPATVDHQGRGTALEVLRALLREGGARPDVRDSDGRSPLLWAASAGSASAVLALVKAGARVDDADRDGLTALHCAASRGHTECIETLLSLCGARTDAADSNGCTALHYAVTLGHADATALLLQHGADAHRQDRKGRSPAHCGAAKGQLETVRMLGARGANLWLRNSKGDLPLHEAVASGRRDLVKWLLDGRPSQVNATNHDGRTPLHVAAATDNADLCRVLLDRGADVNPVARSSRDEPLTPLDCATSRGYRTTAKYLQMHGGLPASKLTNTQIIVDDGPISGLPTRRVTSTRIDVRDRIRIEKREVVEVPGLGDSRRRIPRDDSTGLSDKSSDDSLDYPDRRSKDRQESEAARRSRRRRLEDSQKSFSDGHDSDFGGERRKEKYGSESVEGYKGRVKKSRSRSEPCSKRGGSSNRGRHRHHSESNSSDPDYRRDKKKSKRHRKRSKRKTSTSSESSSSESNDRHSTKRKGKKTSIHITDDEKKQTVNIVNFKKSDSIPSSKSDEMKEKHEDGQEETNLLKGKAQSETETDTASIKNSTVITEAQVHVDRDPSGPSTSDITVTVDSNNKVSIETSTMKVTQQIKEAEKKVNESTSQDNKIITKEGEINKDVSGDKKSKPEDQIPEQSHEKQINENIVIESSVTKKGESEEISNNVSLQQGTLQKSSSDKEFIEKESNASLMATPVVTDEMKSEIKNNLENIGTIEPHVKSGEEVNLDKLSDKDESKGIRKRSFEVLASPDQIKDTLKVPGAEATDKKSSISTDATETGCEGNLNESENSEQEKTDKNESTPQSAVSFAKSKDDPGQVGDEHHLMGDAVDNALMSQGTLDDVPPMISFNEGSNEGRDLNVNRKDYVSTTQSSGEIVGADVLDTEDRGLITVIDSNHTDTDRAVQQVIMGSSQDEGQTDINYPSPQKTRKPSRESQKSSRKSSLYETESYKVLSDVTSSTETKTGILKKSRENINEINDDKESDTATKDLSYSRVGSVSDNEMYGVSEVNGRRKRFRKKIRDKSRSAIRSKSENSERGYESSGLMDSGFEPSPRVVQRTRIMSPRLSAYYQQRNTSGKHSGKVDSRIPVRKPGDKNAVDMKSVTQRIQTNMRRYYCERKIFQHLLELKRLQIRSSKANEAVFVKRAIDEYNSSSLSTVGNGPYSSPDYTFSSFEKFLYDSLRKLQKSGKRHLDKLPEKPIDFDYGESELYKMSSIPDNPCLCTTKTHRCFHAVHAYTGVPCSAYIPHKLNHHTMPKPSSSKAGFLPKIDSKSKAHVTLEVSHGSERQLISLPSEKLEKNKRYYVTFTVKGSNPTSDSENKTNDNIQRNTKSV